MRKYLFISLMLLCFSAIAGIYKWVDDDGNIHYSDKEETGAEQVELSKAVTFTPPTTADDAAPTDQKKDEKRPNYTKMAIVQPKMNETIRDNSGNVSVGIELVPGLMSGDTIRIYLDGKEVLKNITQTSATLSNVERGSHSVRASVFNKDGVVLISSGSVIFHLKIEYGKSEDHTPEDNSDAYTPSYKKDESEETDYSKDYSHDYDKDFSKDYDSSDTYEEGAKKFDSGVPASKDNFKANSNTYTPNYQQK